MDKQSLYCLHNRARYLKGINPLSSNNLLEKAAELRAYDIAIHGTFSHESISGQTATATAKQSGYNYHLIGENLALGDFTNKEFFEEWMQLASHSANVLNSEYNDAGIYVLAIEGSKDKVVVSLFGREK